MKTLASLAAAAVLIALSAPASAQFAKPEDAIHYRQGALTVMGAHFGRLGAMVKGKVSFDAKAAQANAVIVAEMAKLPWAAFGPGTNKGGNTKAKPAIWTEQAKFKEGSDKLIVDTEKLVAASKTGNLDALKTAFVATADTCKSCHDSFRNK